MTQLEQLLKICFEQREDVHERILNAEELAEYIRWMAAEYGGKAGYVVKADAIPDLKSKKLSELGHRILSDPTDSQALLQLGKGYQTQMEDRYILSDYDISAAKVLRYMPAHWHSNEYFEVYYASSGDCPVHFSNEIVTLHPGSLMIVAPGVVHANPCYSDDSELAYYMIRKSTFEQVFWSLLPKENLLAVFFRQALSNRQPNAYLRFETEADPDISRLMKQIYEEYLAEERYCSQMMNALMSACFTLLLRRYEGSARLPRTEQFYWKHEYSAILSDIQTDFASVRLQDLAEKYHYNEKQVRRIVQTCTGMSFSELVSRLRMKKAEALLRSGIPIDEISAAVGYTTVSSFYRAFTAYYGHTPREHSALN